MGSQCTDNKSNVSSGYRDSLASSSSAKSASYNSRRSVPAAPSYFTCTLGAALEYNVAAYGAIVKDTEAGAVVVHNRYRTVNSFIDFLAREHGDRLAFGCCTPVKFNKAAQSNITLTFRDVRTASLQAARDLQSRLSTVARPHDWLALLVTSSPVLLISWLGLIRAGFKVLLIAPQCSSEAISHLLLISDSKALLHDEAHYDLAVAAVSKSSNSDSSVARNHAPAGAKHLVRCIALPESVKAHTDLERGDVPAHVEEEEEVKETAESTDIAYSFHSSGTTGLPKLIEQTHHGAVGALPLLQDSWPGDTITSSFTVTPLYHGGIADVLRSWSAAAPLWLFPEGQLPVTGANVLGCLNSIDTLCHGRATGRQTSLKYMSCVPFVLEAMASHPDMLAKLQSMEMLGVGGAAMAPALAEKLIQAKVNLLSRFGSSECGFLLSSTRVFSQDKHWDYLRETARPLLEFRDKDEQDRFELVVPRAWPLVSTAKHARRPFHTCDLFTSSGGGRWIYKGRSDAMLTLQTGKKLDPEPIEEMLRSEPFISDAIVVGDGRPMPGALIFLSSDNFRSPANEQRETLSHILKEINRTISKYSRIDVMNVRTIEESRAVLIRRNVKGGIVRSSVEFDFHGEISSIYSRSTSSAVQSELTISPERVRQLVNESIQSQSSTESSLDVDDDLFEAGLDSAGCINICRQLQVKLGVELQLGTVYACGNIRTVTDHVIDLLHTKEPVRTHDLEEKSTDSMTAMVAEHIRMQPELLHLIREKLAPNQIQRSRSSLRVYALTGATGFLGVHILAQLLQESTTSKVYVLVRGSHNTSEAEQIQTARTRVNAALQYHKLSQAANQEMFDSRIVYVPYFIKYSCLGLSSTVLNRLTGGVTDFIHAAWEVNFNLPLRAFTSHVKGTVELFCMALLAQEHKDTTTRFVFCSSLASVQNVADLENSSVQKKQSYDPTDSGDLGYAQSKWVAEAVLRELSPTGASKDSSNLQVDIIRVGQLSGDTTHGIWNRSEAWPLMFNASMGMIDSSARAAKDAHATEAYQHGCVTCRFPDLASAGAPDPDWLPVDMAAQMVLQPLLREDFGFTLDARYSIRPVTSDAVSHDQCKTHTSILEGVTRPTATVPWIALQAWACRWAQSRGWTAEVIPALEWIDQLERSAGQHKAKALIPLWRQGWTSSKAMRSSSSPTEAAAANVSTDQSINGTERHPSHFSEDYFRKLLDQIAPII